MAEPLDSLISDKAEAVGELIHDALVVIEPSNTANDPPTIRTELISDPAERLT